MRRFKEADQPLSFPSLLVGSENDPYASAAAAKDLANVWGSQFLNVGKAGHINVDSGHGPWPQGKALLSRLLERCRPREIECVREARWKARACVLHEHFRLTMSQHQNLRTKTAIDRRRFRCENHRAHKMAD